ncbi:AAA family ATPase [bacterium 210820-DFI.6.37]|nr:AAA family ATPase [bacterium 210820-DFI.6.37]
MVYGLIGEKLGHSYSKLIHESLGRYEYDLFSLDKDAFQQFIADRKYSGLNITIPYKKAVIPYCDQVSDLAREIGAVNTLYFQNGKLCGTNTDYQGFLYAADAAGISFEKKKVLILGNGGTSLMARKAAADRGASQILITSRRGEAGCVSYQELVNHRDVEVIVNTTPVGTYPNNGAGLVNLSDFPECGGVIDVIYNPFATDLLQQAEERDIPHTNGLPMLVAQATAAAEYFLGETGFQKENQRIISALRRDIENIVLIGMPGCGKTSLGKRLAKALGKTFVDMDQYIEEQAGQTIPSIFERHGEAHFRQLETQAARELGKEKSQIIATGGGVILRPENMKALSQNGRVVFIQRPLQNLPMDGRPLSKDLNTLKSMYETRFPLYNKYSQLVFTSQEGLETSAEKLLSLLRDRD